MYLTNKEFIAAVRTGTADNLQNIIRGHHRLPQRATLTDRHILNYYKVVRQAVLNRTPAFASFVYDPWSPGNLRPESHNVYKWLRPWDFSEKLKNFTAPEGDFGVGLEVEMGFRTREDAVEAVAFIKNWQHVTADFEGGTNPVEATFPPELYSKFGTRSRVIRYLRNLESMGSKVTPHEPTRAVGTHVNVSNPTGRVNQERLNRTNTFLGRLSTEQKLKYFGRPHPYSYGYTRGNQRKNWIEWKLFNSTTNWKQLRMYVNVGVALAALVADTTRELNQVEVLNTLEKAYTKNRL